MTVDSSYLKPVLSEGQESNNNVTSSIRPPNPHRGQCTVYLPILYIKTSYYSITLDAVYVSPIQCDVLGIYSVRCEFTRSSTWSCILYIYKYDEINTLNKRSSVLTCCYCGDICSTYRPCQIKCISNDTDRVNTVLFQALKQH